MRLNNSALKWALGTAASAVAALALLLTFAGTFAASGTVLADFEGGAPAGWFEYKGPGSSVSTVTQVVADSDGLARPGQVGDNEVLAATFNVTDWGGLGDDVSLTYGEPQDWSNFPSFEFWFYGTGSGLTYQAEISDNRSDPNTDTAERFDYTFTDSVAGWQFMSIPFTDFTRATDFQPGGAPNDGFTLTEIWAWAIVLPAGADTVYFDDVALGQRIVDDFESGLPNGTDGDNAPIGFYTFSDGSPIAITTTTTLPAPVPGISNTNTVLRMDTNVIAYAGFIHAFENDAVDTWIPQDWSTHEGIRFWFYGQNTGTVLFMDIMDNRNPGSTSDDAERFVANFTDDSTGWRLIEFPFTSFTRKEIGNGAPNDGLTLTEMHGWALGALTTSGAFSFYIDEVALYGVAAPPDLAVSFSNGNFDIVEGTTGQITVRLNRAMTDDDPAQVSVDYATERSTAEAGRDFTPTNGTLTFVNGGPSEQTFSLETFADGKAMGNTSVILRLSNFVDVGTIISQASALIVDADTVDPYLIDDFEHGTYLWEATAGTTLSQTEIPSGDPMEVPGQGAYENVMTVTPPSGTDAVEFSRDFALGQDWSRGTALRFWYYGTNSGADVGVTLKDNRAADPGPSGWSLVWSDEFDDPAGTPPNPDNWTHEIGDVTPDGKNGWGNEELQYYTDNTDNAATDGNGNLVIHAIEISDTVEAGTVEAGTVQADGTLACYYGPCEYTSARLISWHKAEFAYGRIETRALVPGASGIWPAFWSLGTNIDVTPWPGSGEIDIMEFIGRVPNEVFGTIHGPGYSGGGGISNTYNLGEPVSNNYHTFAIEWQPDLINWYVDDILYHTASPADVGSNEWVFNRTFFLLLNVAVGGTFGGDVDPGAIFPQSMYVDYVRVYQGPDSAEQFEASFVDNFSGWQEVVIPFTDFTRSADQPAGAPDDGLTLSDVWGYGFTFPQGGSETKVDQVRLDLETAPTDITVTNLDDSGDGSLRQALEYIAAGGTVDFDPSLADGTITLTSGPLVPSNDVTIDATLLTTLTIDGGGTDRVVVIDAGRTVSVTNVIMTNGYADQLGGGVLNNGTLTLDHVSVTNNTMATAGGDWWQGGGGIYNGDGATLNLIDSTVADNLSGWTGGGIYSFFNTTTSIVRSTISGNTSSDVAGGLRILGTGEIINSTISGNTSTAWHGGALFQTDGTMTIVNSTLTGNNAPSGTAGAIFVGTFGASDASVELTNTILANNGDFNCVVVVNGSGSVTLTSNGNNVVTDGTCTPTGSDVIIGDAGLEPLANNGGPTLTHALTPWSPALDIADSTACPATDQRGIPRPQNTGCDIGAFEYAETADVTFVKAVDGGDAQPSDWTFDVDGGPTGIAHNATETIITGTYTVTESGPDGYTATSASGACSLSNGVISLTVTALTADGVAAAEAVGETCTITNTRDTGDITFIKAVEGGDAQPSDWTFDVSDGGPTGIAHNATEAIDTGTYTVTESGPDGYTATGASGACSLTDGVISLTVTAADIRDVGAAGSLGATCTITNSLRTDTVASPTGAGDVTYTVDACAIGDFSAVAEATLPTTGKPDIDFAYGFFGLTLEGCDVGGTANITVTLPSNLPTGSQFWKHQNDIWFQHPFASDDGDNVISFSLTDGGAGDADGTANGVIVDPAGPGITAAGVILTESFGVTDLDEDGSPVGRACYWVTLASAPSADVTITPSPDGQVTVQPTSLVLNSSNWDALGAKSNKICVRPVQDDATEGTPDAFCAAKKVDIYGTGADDVQVCGSHLGHVDHTVTSSDTNYNGADVSTTGPDLDSDTSTIDVLIRDDDTAGLIFTPGALNVLEGGNVSYNVALRSQPKDTVSVSAAQASALTFTPVTWNIPQTMTLTLPDDSEANGIRTAGIRHDVGSSDSVYAGLGETVVTLPMTVTDDDAAGAVVNHGAMALAEGGASASYGLRLTVAPGADVVITVVSGSQVSATPAQLTFTPENWNQEQTVTLTAVDDAVDEGDTADVRIGHTAGSSDVAYDNVAIAQLTARVTDNDTAAVAVGQAAQASIVEGGATTYPVTLATQPTAPVRLFVVTDGKTTATPDVLIFDAATWNVAQTVTLTGLDDAVDNAADARTSLVTHAAVSADAAYDGIADEELTVDVVDNDVAAVLLSQSEMELAQGSRASYSVSLATEPLSPVLVSLSASGVTVDASCGAAASTAPCLRFTPENWNTPQAVDVTALSGALGFVEHRTISADAAYNGRILHLTVNGVGLESVFLPLVTR